MSILLRYYVTFFTSRCPEPSCSARESDAHSSWARVRLGGSGGRANSIEIFRRRLRLKERDVGGHLIDGETAGGHRHFSGARSAGLRKRPTVSINLATEIGFDR
jgi:hypothetical protein